MQIIAGSCGKYTAVNSIFSAEKLPKVLKIWNNGFLENIPVGLGLISNTRLVIKPTSFSQQDCVACTAQLGTMSIRSLATCSTACIFVGLSSVSTSLLLKQTVACVP